jgi:hypothetical protein
MVIYGSTTHAYYPISGKGSDLIRGTGRIRYVRGFIVVNPKESKAAKGSHSRREKLT